MDNLKASLVNRIIEFSEKKRIEVKSLRGLPLVFEVTYRSDIWPWDESYDKVAQLGFEFAGEKIRLLSDKYASYDTIYDYKALAYDWNKNPEDSWDDLFRERNNMLAQKVESNIRALEQALEKEKNKLKELRTNELP